MRKKTAFKFTVAEIAGTNKTLVISSTFEENTLLDISGLLARVDADGEVYCERRRIPIWEGREARVD